MGIFIKLVSVSIFSLRLSCVVPAAVAPPPHLYAANPPVPYSLDKKSSSRRLTEAAAPHSKALQRLASRHILPCPDLQLMQMDSGESAAAFSQL